MDGLVGNAGNLEFDAQVNIYVLLMCNAVLPYQQMTLYKFYKKLKTQFRPICHSLELSLQLIDVL